MYRSWIPWMALALGCSGDDGGDGNKTTDATTGTTFDRSATLEGVVLDPSGSQLIDAPIRFCRGPACRNAQTDGAGTYRFDEVHVDWHSFEVQPPVGTDGLPTLLVPLVFETDEARTLDVVLPPLDPPTPLSASPEEIEVGRGLFVTVGLDDLEPPLFFDPTSEVAGVQLDADEWVPTDWIEGTVLAQWFLHPFDYHAADGLPTRVANDFGLADGAAARLYVGSYELSQWVDAGALTVGPQWLDGAVLPQLSTVILVAE